ncbi:MAG: FkbM family methyltransferase [Holosporaceae bacterium]|jgi:FkbM family methyltransferase|nr:FkbM family methyltransferase [Holosporaceae bacterium]
MRKYLEEEICGTEGCVQSFREALNCRCFISETNNGLWMMLINDDLISTKIRRLGVWEPHVTNYLVKNVKHNEVVIELGANIGYHTVLMAKLVSPLGRVYSYEVNDEVYDFAKMSLRMNDLSHIVKMKNVGISDKTGEALLHYTPLNSSVPTNIGMAHIDFAENGGKGELVKKVKMTSLDEDLPELKNVDWLRMDIEGSELPAIHGARRIIESSPNLKIVMEWAPCYLEKFGDLSAFIDLLHNYGFIFYRIEDDGNLGDEMPKEKLLEADQVDLVLLRNR